MEEKRLKVFPYQKKNLNKVLCQSTTFKTNCLASLVFLKYNRG